MPSSIENKAAGVGQKEKKAGNLIPLFPVPRTNDFEELVLEHRISARKMASAILQKWGCYLELDELHSLVDLALCTAAQSYCPNKGTEFTTFLYYYLLGQLRIAITGRAKDVHIFTEMQGQNFSETEKNKEVDHIVHQKQLFELILNECKQLEDVENQILRKVYTNDQQVKKVAQELGLSRAHVSRVKTKALVKLRRRVRNRLEETIKHNWQETELAAVA